MRYFVIITKINFTIKNMESNKLDIQAQKLLTENIKEEDKFKKLCELAKYGVYPYKFDFINKYPLPSNYTEEMVHNLFLMGYHPSPKDFYLHVGEDVYNFASLYMKYVGIPYVPELVTQDNEAKYFVPYVINDLDKIIRQIIDATYNDADVGLRQGKNIGLKVLHSLYSLKADHNKGIFSLSRVKTDKEYIVSFKLASIPDIKKKKQGRPLIDVDNVKINLLVMDEPLSELKSLKDMMDSKEFYNWCAYRLALDDCTDIPPIPLDFVVSNSVFFGPFIEYLAFMGCSMVDYFKSLGYKEAQLLDNIKDQLMSLCKDISIHMDKITAVKNYYKNKYKFDVVVSNNITVNNGNKTYTLTFKGNLVYSNDNKTLISFKDNMEEEDFNRSFALNLIKGDRSVKIEEAKGFNSNYQIIYTTENKGTYQGSVPEIMAFFNIKGIEELGPNFSCYNNGFFAKALLNGRNYNPYKIKYTVNPEDVLRYKVYQKVIMK
jgi:hypothetical protein